MFERCNATGRFLGCDNYVYLIPYGSYGDIDEPDPEFLSLEYWDSLDEKGKELIRKTSYIGPIVYRGGKKEMYGEKRSPCSVPSAGGEKNL